jgi:ribosomal protein L37E
MFAASRFLALSATLQTVAGLVQPTLHCQFDNEPMIPYFWDEEGCPDGQSLGCLADGVNNQCRFCGTGEYESVPCPVSQCSFDNPPHTPYYWDTSCLNGGVGCNADSHHQQCRFCGEFPYNGTVPCPALGVVSPVDVCTFDNEPETPYFWDSSCEEGMLGCRADDQHLGCRFCGGGAYSSVLCPASLCTFGMVGKPVPVAPYGYYWEPQCWNTADHILGCLGDGVHQECRYCGGNEYTSIPCPQNSLMR